MSRVEINSPAPDFSLPDFKGETFQLSSWRREKNIVLVFNRGFM